MALRKASDEIVVAYGSALLRWIGKLRRQDQYLLGGVVARHRSQLLLKDLLIDGPGLAGSPLSRKSPCLA